MVKNKLPGFVILILILWCSQKISATNETYSENFDSSYSGWTTEDMTANDTSLWHKITTHPMDSVSYHSADTSWWCGIDADTFYPGQLNDALILDSVFNLTGKNNPRLKFWYFLDKDTDAKAYVDVSTDSGTSWDVGVGNLSPISAKWDLEDLDLSAYADSAIKIRFRFNSNNSAGKYGWFIDDVSVVNITSTTVVDSNDFDDSTYTNFTHYAIIDNDNWDTTNSSTNSSPRSYHASEDADANWDALQSPELNFSALSSPKLSFYHRYEFGIGASDPSNGGIVEITTDTTVDSAAWIKIYPIGGYPNSCKYCKHSSPFIADFGNPLGDTAVTGDSDVEGFYGFQTTFGQAEFDLSAYAGSSSVWIRFSSGTDVNNSGNNHWYIDDFQIIEVGAAETLYFSDMENSNDKYTTFRFKSGNWWSTADSSFSQIDGINPYNSADSSKYCGYQSSRNGDGTYDLLDNGNLFLNNGLRTPFIDISSVSASDGLVLNFQERRRVGTGNFNVEVQVASDSAWDTLQTQTTNSYNGNFGQANYNWEPNGVELSNYSAQDSIRIRFRAFTQHELYWYIDDLQLIRSANNIIDYSKVTSIIPSATIASNSDTFDVFKLHTFDADGITLDTLFLNFVNVSGGISSSDFNPLSDDIQSGISLFDSSGNRVALNAGASGWNGLTAKLVFSSGNGITATPTNTHNFKIKIRTSITVLDSEQFQITIDTSQNIAASNGERIGLINVVTTGTITVTNSAPADPTGFSANLTDSTVSLSWNSNSESDLSHYNLYKSSTQGFTPDSTNLLVQINQPGSTYTDTVSIGAAIQYYKLSAEDSSNTESGFKSDSVDQVPAAPSGLTATEGDTVINVKWNSNSEADLSHYNVYRDTTTGFTPDSANLLVQVSKPETTYIDTGVTIGLHYYYKISAVDSNSGESGYSGETDSPVPVTLSSFIAEASGDGVLLRWITQTEENNLGWNVLRSITANSNFTKVNTALLPGNVVSTSPQEYVYKDVMVKTGTHYYMLEQIDLDGTKHYSNIISVSFSTSIIVTTGSILEGSINEIIITPNPFTRNITIQVVKNNISTIPVTVDVFSVEGELIQHLGEIKNNVILWDGNNYKGMAVPSGLYMFRVKHGHHMQSKWGIKIN